MQTVAGLCLLLFVLTTSLVGVRMILLARRTRGRHEFLMGAGMALVGMIGFPASLVSGFGRPIAELNVPIWSASSIVSIIGITLIYAFTWQVFRPKEAWGKALVAAGAAFMLGGQLLALRAVLHARPEENSQLVARNALFIAMIGYCGCFLWSSIEGFLHYRAYQRRMALGLADAVVVNRFLLWGIFGLMATAINVASATGNALGVDPSHSPMVLVPMGVFGFGASAAIYLAFLPPAPYLAFLRGRSTPQRA